MTPLDLWHLITTAEGPVRWALSLLLAILVGAAGELLLQMLFRSLRALAERTETAADDHLIARMRIPSRMALATFCLHLGAVAAAIEWPLPALRLTEWLCLTFILVETVETLLVDLVLEERLHVKVPGLLRQVGIGMVYLGLVLVVLARVAGLDLTPLLATTSVVSLVLGLALQQPLSNLFAGLVLHADRPFQENDWIIVNGREGRVLEMGWRSTRLATLSGDVVVLPNTTLLGAEILNTARPTTATARQVELVVSPLVPPRALERWVVEELANVPGIQEHPEPLTWLVRLEPNFHRYILKFWVENFSIHDGAESEVLKRMWYRLQKEGFPIVLPTPVQLLKELEVRDD